MENEFSEENGQKLVDEHRLLKLKEIATLYNKLPENGLKHTKLHKHAFVEVLKERPTHSFIKEYQKAEEYIFALWLRRVEIPEVLTFGEPLKDKFSPSSRMMKDALTSIRKMCFYVL